ncbi:MAG: alpha/beta hydrolase [Dongiaceae bacterium]
MSPPDLTGPEIGALKGTAKSLVIFLHGLGADGHDLISLAPLWIESMPDTAFISPNAPYPCEGAPMGRQWFKLWDQTPDQISANAKMATPILENFIARKLKSYGVPANKLALVGFSQGTMMSLEFALRYPEKIAGIVGYSGALLGAEKLAQEIKAKPPVLLIHGQDDPVVPPAMMAMAEGALKSAGIEVETHLRPNLQHGIDDIGVHLGGEFLKRVLY